MGEITKREVIASISIIVIMLVLGFLISGKISERQMDINEVYNKAVKIDSTDMFEYGMRTNVGNAFVYGDLKAVDPVTYSEIGGKYMYVEKVEERYERHEEWVTKTDSNGNEYEELEVWYEWDVENVKSKHCKKLEFCGVVFPYSKINIPSSGYIDTLSGDRVWSRKSGEYVKVRFQYYGTKVKHTGTIFTELKDNTITKDSNFYRTNINETIERLEKGSGGLIFFWVVWIILIGLCVFGFYYLDNRWLE